MFSILFPLQGLYNPFRGVGQDRHSNMVDAEDDVILVHRNVSREKILGPDSVQRGTVRVDQVHTDRVQN